MTREQLDEFRIGDRIEMHPATDAWFRGDRYGEVRKIGRRLLHVQLDKSGRTIRTTPSNIYRIVREA